LCKKQNFSSGQGIRDYLYNNRNTFFPKSVVNDYDKLVENLSTIADWTEDNPGEYLSAP
jgi:hypothetical protein